MSAEAFDLDDPAVAELAASFLADRLDGKREKVLLDTDIGRRVASTGFNWSTHGFQMRHA